MMRNSQQHSIRPLPPPVVPPPVIRRACQPSASSRLCRDILIAAGCLSIGLLLGQVVGLRDVSQNSAAINQIESVSMASFLPQVTLDKPTPVADSVNHQVPSGLDAWLANTGAMLAAITAETENEPELEFEPELIESLEIEADVATTLEVVSAPLVEPTGVAGECENGTCSVEKFDSVTELAVAMKPMVEVDEVATDDTEIRKPGTLGTAVHWSESPAEAYKTAADEKKLVFLIHVSGNFAIPGFT
jgi:hypothetical protein